ncbi:MAG: UDP-3-O-(3-hydroxymyristoyl)glucosamine N-acyltransferase [Prevotella sp.]|jgi:UDP-3-O-[3-hydroxymyristoyl] glucosamine N-acyltransferase|nr:UDP-3-O-(3-hydroxymyristoyl)glucosamine N-acyltransferase [Prevotella sp.]
MEFTAKQIAQFIQGSIEGNENVTINTFAKIEEGVPGAISFLSNPKYTHYIYETKSSVVLVDETLILDKPVETTIIRVVNARDCVAKLLQMYDAAMHPKKTGVDSLAFISSNAQIGKNVYIGAFACIGDGAVIGDGCQIYPNTVIGDNVKLGNDCIIYPNVTVYMGCKLGNRITIHSGSVIGADGFGFAPNGKDGYDKIPQIGIVTIEDDVEIGANTCIDRSTMGSTVIRRGVKLDNLIQIAHNVEVGENTVMSAQVGISGSTKVGQWCMFGGQVGIAGHIEIGDKVFLGGQSGVIGNLKSNQMLIGTPPMGKLSYFKSQALVQKLPELFKEIEDLKKEVTELKKQK